MADSTFPLELITPAEKVRNIECECLTVRLFDGEAAFLRGHSPFFGALCDGYIRVRCGETVDRYEIGDAFLQVTERGAAIFSDRCRKME